MYKVVYNTIIQCHLFVFLFNYKHYIHNYSNIIFIIIVSQKQEFNHLAYKIFVEMMVSVIFYRTVLFNYKKILNFYTHRTYSRL